MATAKSYKMGLCTCGNAQNPFYLSKQNEDLPNVFHGTYYLVGGDNATMFMQVDMTGKVKPVKSPFKPTNQNQNNGIPKKETFHIAEVEPRPKVSQGLPLPGMSPMRNTHNLPVNTGPVIAPTRTRTVTFMPHKEEPQSPNRASVQRPRSPPPVAPKPNTIPRSVSVNDEELPKQGRPLLLQRRMTPPSIPPKITATPVNSPVKQSPFLQRTPSQTSNLNKDLNGGGGGSTVAVEETPMPNVPIPPVLPSPEQLKGVPQRLEQPKLNKAPNSAPAVAQKPSVERTPEQISLTDAIAKAVLARAEKMGRVETEQAEEEESSSDEDSDPDKWDD